MSLTVLFKIGQPYVYIKSKRYFFVNLFLYYSITLLICSFIHAGQMLNGIAGCVVMAAPPYLSNLWFPPHERITATGVATLLNYMGE